MHGVVWRSGKEIGLSEILMNKARSIVTVQGHKRVRKGAKKGHAYNASITADVICMLIVLGYISFLLASLGSSITASQARMVLSIFNKLITADCYFTNIYNSILTNPGHCADMVDLPSQNLV